MSLSYELVRNAELCARETRYPLSRAYNSAVCADS